MTVRFSPAVRVTLLTLISWLFVSIIFAMPVLAEEEEEDDEDGRSTTTTTIATTTTTPPTTTITSTTTTTQPSTTTTKPTTTTTTKPTTTTTKPKPGNSQKTTTTTAPAKPSTTSSTTTTTVPSTTTTSASADRQSSPAPIPVHDGGPPGPPEDGSPLTTKEGLVVLLTAGGDGSSAIGGTGQDGFRHIDPRENLAVAIRLAGATLEGQILEAIALGLVVAVLTVVGVDRSRVRRPRPDWARSH